MLALIDGDLVTYRCAAVTEQTDIGLAKWQADEMLERIVKDISADSFRIFLTAGNNNFRYLIYPDYKANRRDQPKPKHLEPLREHLVLHWGAELVDGYEADDALGIASQVFLEDSFIASIDKDLLQLPGKHYNFVRREIKEVDEIGGAKQFYRQLLIGDPTDNIRGCPGIGPVKAKRAIDACQSVGEMYRATCGLFRECVGEKWEECMDLNAQLIYIWRSDPDNWKRLFKQEADLPPVSST